jgi:exodeoxyribonuclease VII small subunit
MAKANTSASYESLRQELDDILDELQREDLTVDKALAGYKRGLELVRQLETYLKTAENNVSELKAKFDAGPA